MVPSILKIAITITALSLLSQVSIPLAIGEAEVVPITLQSLVVLVAAAFLKPWEAISAYAIYIFIGVLGMPVFASGKSGIEVLTGGTGGYLLGFVVSGAVIAYIYQVKKVTGFLKHLGAMLLGTVIIILCGVAYLAVLKGGEIAIQYGFLPIWKGAIIKIFLGAILVYFIHRSPLQKIS